MQTTQLKNANEGDEITIQYNSAHSDDIQDISGEVREAGMSWNGEMVEVEFKNSDGIYTVRMAEDGSSGQLVRNQYDWCRGERTRQTGQRRITSWNTPGAVDDISVGSDDEYTCWMCGESFPREADHNAHVEFECEA